MISILLSSYDPYSQEKTWYMYIYYLDVGWRLLRVVFPPNFFSLKLSISSFHYVYLLQSLTYSRRTYIGYTIDLNRRLRQHNGDLSGGAKRTIKGRPWKMICYLSGFPDQRTALQYEWANNHPKIKRWGVNGRLRTLEETLKLTKFQGIPIELTFL